MKSLLIAVDFDDTIAQNTCYPEVGPPVKGAIEGLNELVKAGHRIQIWTCRHSLALDNAKNWLDLHGVPHERINENCPVLIEQWGETRKMSADVYIDDKNLGGLPIWGDIPNAVQRQVAQIEVGEQRVKFLKLPQIIALSGKRGSGKDTVANLIERAGPWAFFEQRLFAGKLKRFAQELTGHQDMFSQEGKTLFLPDWGMTAGELLQRLGTDAIRDGLHTDAWVLACFAGMRKDQHYIITDCRFPNEAEAIKAKGGFVLRVEGDPLKQRGDGTRNDAHPSETALDDYQHFDAVIQNTGTLDELRAKVRALLDSLTK